MSREFGNLSPGRYIVNKAGVPILQKSRSSLGFVIEGIASKFDTILYTESHGFINIQPDAFKISIKYDPVECWVDHDEALCLKGCRVELHSTETELNFRLHLDDSELAGHARDLVSSGAYTQCSLGWHSSKHVTRVIGGSTEVKFLLAGTLTHIALVPSGAIPTTHCQVSELKNCGTLADDCKSHRFESDNAFTELRRAMRRLESK
jgi:HK97 family phage prohead protease